MVVKNIRSYGLNELYKYIGKVKTDPDYEKASFRNHLGNLYYAINIILDIEGMNILELFFAKKMYGHNIIFEDIKSIDSFEDDSYQKLFDSIDNDESPLFAHTCNCKVIINGPSVLGVLSTDMSFDPVDVLSNITKGKCFTKEGKFISNISKYTTDINNFIINNFVSSLYSYMYKSIFDGDLLSDYGIESLLFNKESDFSLLSITTLSDCVENIDSSKKDEITSIFNKLKELYENGLSKKIIEDSTFISFSIKATLLDLILISKILPCSCITNYSPFLYMINKDNERFINIENKFRSLIEKEYKNNLLRRTVCLPIDTPCSFTLRISFSDAISYLTSENRTENNELIEKIFVFMNSFYQKIF